MITVPGLLVTSGKGGVGKTLLSANLAIELSRYVRVALVDADIRAPNLSYVMGLRKYGREFANRKLIPYHHSDTLEIFSTDHFLAVNGKKRAIMPTGEEVRAIVQQSITAVAWNNPDIFVMDSDPSTGDVFFAVRDVFGPMLSAVVVTTNDVSSLFDCERTIDALMINDINIMSVVGNMIFDGDDGGVRALCSRFDLKYAGYIPFDSAVRKKNNAGDPGMSGSEIITQIVGNILHRRSV